MSPLYRLPLEVLEKIVASLHDDPATPPTAIVPLLLASKVLYNKLGFRTNNALYARLFRLSFDHTAPTRRLGDLKASGFSAQLRANYDALRAIRRGDIFADNLLQTFWTAFSMLMENDGRNRHHLDTAGLADFVDNFIRQRLYEDAPHGWPAENEVNSLALWLLWLTMTEDRLRAESPAQRAHMTQLILPYVLMPVRYAAYLAPHVHYAVPLQHDPSHQPHSFVTAHGRYPHYRKCSRTIHFYHRNALELGVPLASVAAKLIYFAHRELNPVGVPPHLARTRAEAPLNRIGPTQEDVHELNEHKIARFMSQPTWEWWSEIRDYDKLDHEARSKLAPSARWDDDWNRLTDCINVFKPVSLKRTHYTPGLLSGLWQGRMLHPDDGLYGNVIQIPQMPQAFGEQSVGLIFTPLFMRLREYHCMDVDPNKPALSGGIENAWFHGLTHLQEDTHALTIRCQESTTCYREWVDGDPDLHDESKCRGCKHRGTSDMIFRECDEEYLSQQLGEGIISQLDETLAAEPMDDVEDVKDDAMDYDTNDTDTDVDMVVDDELVIKRKCNGILDIVLVGETDDRHGQAWHHYRFYGRVREWDGLVALIRVPTRALGAALGTWIFTGYVVGGTTLVGNWRAKDHPGEPVTIEGAFAVSKRE